jgi:hypothetical protein
MVRLLLGWLGRNLGKLFSLGIVDGVKSLED